MTSNDSAPQSGLLGTLFNVFSFDLETQYTHEAWRGRARTCGGIGSVLPLQKIEAFDSELQEILTEHYGTQPMHVPHRVWCVNALRFA